MENLNASISVSNNIRFNPAFSFHSPNRDRIMVSFGGNSYLHVDPADFLDMFLRAQKFIFENSEGFKSKIETDIENRIE